MLSRSLIVLLLPGLSMYAWGQQQPSRNLKPSTATQWLRSLTLEQQIAQLVVIPFYGDNPSSRSRAYQQFASLVGKTGAGGMILVNRVHRGGVVHAEPHAAAAFLNRMQRLAKIPLLVGADFERGASMRVNGTTKFPHNMAFAAAGDLEGSTQEGAATAREARALGVHWIFAPVADVNNNPDNPIINIRAYSEHAADVAAHVKAYIRGAKANTANPVLVTVKHFPGHGDTAVDSHVGLAKVEAGGDRLKAVELAPFRAAIEAGVDSIMTAHLWVPALEERELPATVSPAVLTGLLRKELGFKGLIVTDAMDMQGLSRQMTPAEAAVRAIEAGVDVLLMPPQPLVAIAAVAKAVRSGRLSRARLEQSVMRVLNAKVSLGLHKKRTVDLEELADGIESDEAEAVSRRVARKAVTLVKNEGGMVPLGDPEQSCWFVLSENRYGSQGRRMMEVLDQRFPKARRLLLDPLVSAGELESAAASVRDCASVVAAAFASPAAYRGTAGLSEEYTRLLESLLASGKPVALVSLGNPYLLRGFPNVSAYLATFSTSPVAEEAAVRALAGDTAIEGRLPVSIPPLAKSGDGLRLPARSAPQPVQ
ncbi:MAG: glycoside hydrolase family 3 N-terminal domain-containing protein [Bryobacteraceae bacterium]|nr:glycoside hydrolase family 3 N-terminal domain-containing protein [Bryobacteraceae bacterium]